MTLRTTSVRHQWLAWACLALVGVVAYFVLVRAFGLGDPFRFFGAHQLRVFLPMVIVLRYLAWECRWDGIEREEDEMEEMEEIESRARTTGPWTRSDANAARDGASRELMDEVRKSAPFPSYSERPEDLWERARAQETVLDPDLSPEENDIYMRNVRGAAEGGHVAALARLGELAFLRGAYVEAYFWTKVARRRLELENPSDERGLKEIGDMLRKIRCAWSMVGQPSEYENVYDFFPEERGELGRAFLRLDGGIEVKQTLEYIRALAENGNPDAALFL